MPQYRTYYPVHSVAFAPHGMSFLTQPTGYIPVHGLQSVASTTNFNLEQVFEIGQIEIYDNIEDIPDVELTLTKVIDGYPLVQHLASRPPQGSTLNSRYGDARSNVITAIYNQLNNAASGTPLSVAFMSGMYVSSLSFSFPVEGNCTESVTLVGNNKVWFTGGLPTGLYTVGSRFNNADVPALGATTGVARRQEVNMTLSVWPGEIPGIDTAGGAVNSQVGGVYNAHIQNVNVSVNLGREDLFELGRRGQYHRYASFPTEVTTSIEITAGERGDFKNANEETTNLVDNQIYIVIGTTFGLDLGTKNKLTSITTNGGDATGGNMTVTYNYSNFNSFTVLQTGSDFL